jgi:signal transduction histidine kinase
MRGIGQGFREFIGSLRPSGLVIAGYGVASLVGASISLSSALGSIPSMVAVSVTATLVSVLLLALSHVLPWSSWADRPLMSTAIFMCIAAFIGLVRGFVFVQLSAQWGIELSSSNEAQMVNSSFSALVWLTLIGLVVAGRDRYSRRYRALLLHGDAEFDWDSHPNVQQVKRNVSEAIIGSSEQTTVNLVSVAEAIRREIDTNIRPLSHRLWFGSEGEEPRARLGALVLDALSLWTVPVRSVTVIWFVTAVLGGTRWLGGQVALFAASASTVLLFVMIVVVRRFVPENKWMRACALLLGSIAVILGSDLILRILGVPSRLLAEFPMVIVLPLSLAALVVTAAAISLAESDRQWVLQVAKQEVHLVAEARRQSAYLHNSFQSELTGLAMQLERAATAGSSDDARTALERVHSLLSRSISEDFASFQEQPWVRFQRVMNSWSGICTVKIEIDDDALKDARIGVCVQAIEEVIANAVRHSGASHVHIHVSQHALGLNVRSVSDGTAMSDAGTGLGTVVLNAVAPGGLMVKQSESGTTVHFTIE